MSMTSRIPNILTKRLARHRFQDDQLDGRHCIHLPVVEKERGSVEGVESYFPEGSGKVFDALSLVDIVALN